MTREELKAHCIRQIEQIEMWAKYKGEKPSGKVYAEHKLILELLEQEQQADNEWCTDCKEYDHEKHCCPRFSQVIKTTLQECCEDAISREDVLLTLTGEDLPDDASKLISIFGERIKNLPPMKPQEPRWIPVSERLPEDKEIILITSSDMYLSKLNPWCGWKNRNNWYTFTANGSYLIKYPIAWMPLPKPYTAESEGDK